MLGRSGVKSVLSVTTDDLVVQRTSEDKRLPDELYGARNRSFSIGRQTISLTFPCGPRVRGATCLDHRLSGGFAQFAFAGLRKQGSRATSMTTNGPERIRASEKGGGAPQREEDRISGGAMDKG